MRGHRRVAAISILVGLEMMMLVSQSGAECVFSHGINYNDDNYKKSNVRDTSTESTVLDTSTESVWDTSTESTVLDTSTESTVWDTSTESTVWDTSTKSAVRASSAIVHNNFSTWWEYRDYEAGHKTTHIRRFTSSDMYKFKSHNSSHAELADGTEQFNCSELEEVERHTYARSYPEAGGIVTCIKLYLSGDKNFLLDWTVTAQDDRNCSKWDYEGSATVLIKTHGVYGEEGMVDVNCSSFFVRGRYNVEMNAMNDLNICSGSSDSIATIDGSEIVIDTCREGYKYKKPVDTILKCLGELEKDIAEENSNHRSGGVLIMKEDTEAMKKRWLYWMGQPRYYIARYESNDDDIHLSLAGNRRSTHVFSYPDFDHQSMTESAERFAVTFTMKRIKVLHTLQGYAKRLLQQHIWWQTWKDPTNTNRSLYKRYLSDKDYGHYELHMALDNMNKEKGYYDKQRYDVWSSTQEGDVLSYVRQRYNDSLGAQCVRLLMAPETDINSAFLLIEDVSEVPKPRGVETKFSPVDKCTFNTWIGARVRVRWHFTNFRPCPFPVGHYQAAVTLPDGSHHCANAAVSSVDVTYVDHFGAMDFNLCLNGNNYSKPFKGVTLRCMGRLQNSVIQNFASYSDSLLLLAYSDIKGNFTDAYFFTVHYKSEDKDKTIHLKFYGRNEWDYVNPLQNAAYFKHEITLHAKTCGNWMCENGGGCIDDESRRCACPRGYTGVFCETRLQGSSQYRPKGDYWVSSFIHCFDRKSMTPFVAELKAPPNAYFKHARVFYKRLQLPIIGFCDNPYRDLSQPDPGKHCKWDPQKKRGGWDSPQSSKVQQDFLQYCVGKSTCDLQVQPWCKLNVFSDHACWKPNDELALYIEIYYSFQYRGVNYASIGNGGSCSSKYVGCDGVINGDLHTTIENRWGLHYSNHLIYHIHIDFARKIRVRRAYVWHTFWYEERLCKKADVLVNGLIKYNVELEKAGAQTGYGEWNEIEWRKPYPRSTFIEFTCKPDGDYRYRYSYAAIEEIQVFSYIDDGLVNSTVR